MPFKKGQSGNPAGQHVGTRRKLNEKFLRGLLQAYEKGGDQAIEDVMRDDPATFIKACLALQPKEANLGVNVTHTLVDVLTHALDTANSNRQHPALEAKPGQLRN